MALLLPPPRVSHRHWRRPLDSTTNGCLTGDRTRRRPDQSRERRGCGASRRRVIQQAPAASPLSDSNCRVRGHFANEQGDRGGYRIRPAAGARADARWRVNASAPSRSYARAKPVDRDPMGRLQGADEFDAQLAARDVTCLLALGKHAIDTTPSNERQSRAGDRRGTWSLNWGSELDAAAISRRAVRRVPADLLVLVQTGDTISVLRGLSLSICDAPPDDPALGTTVVHMSRPGGSGCLLVLCRGWEVDLGCG